MIAQVEIDNVRHSNIISYIAFSFICILTQVSCSRNHEAAEIANSFIHTLDLTTPSTEIPNDLISGQCRNQIESGTGTPGSQTVAIGNKWQFTYTFAVILASGCNNENNEGDCEFNCTFTAAYNVNAARTRLFGGGEITTCNNFNCKFRGVVLQCEDFKKALKEQSCDSTNLL